MLLNQPPLFKIIFQGRSVWKFVTASVLSFGFSIAVILSTIGLMDGFELTLKKSLKKSTGEILIYEDDSMIQESEAKEALSKLPIEFTPVLQVEAFALHEEESKGVLIKGIDAKSFNKVANLKLKNLEQNVAIGRSLAKEFGVQIGDSIIIAFNTPHAKTFESTLIETFEITQIISHGVHEQDMRFLYMDLKNLRSIMGYRNDVLNIIYANRNQSSEAIALEDFIQMMNLKMQSPLSAKTYFSSFETLINAVKIEKLSITLILQLIVVIAIFNILALMIFISEKKTQEFFVLKTFGLTKKTLTFFWTKVFLLIWSLSSLLSLVLTALVDKVVLRLPFFKIPSDIYVLDHLQLELKLDDYLIVFAIALIWVALIGFIGIWRINQKSILSGLRQEFS
jgi:ABC-type lipoprotein release transport system permease subunit